MLAAPKTRPLLLSCISRLRVRGPTQAAAWLNRGLRKPRGLVLRLIPGGLAPRVGAVSATAAIGIPRTPAL